MTDQARVLREMALAAEQRASGTKYAPRVIVVTSGKGGVGKTNLSINLGTALVQRGRRVALVDADIGLANVDIVLGVSPPYTLRHVVLDERSLSEAIVVAPGGLHVLGGGSGVREWDDLDAHRLQKFVETLESLDRAFDVVLIDTGAGLGSHVLSFVEASPETLLVVTPDPSSLADAYALIKAMASRRDDVRWLVAVNMVRMGQEGEQTFQRLAATARRFLGVSPTYLGAVPYDEAVVRAAHLQSPFVLAFSRAPAARAVGAMADRLWDGKPRAAPWGFGDVVRRLLRFGK